MFEDVQQRAKVLLALTLGAIAVGGIAASSAHAFGSWNGGGNGQLAEHERMTRAAMRSIFDPETLDAFAGTDGDLGAIGASDNGPATFIDARHCDNADYLPVRGYPQPRKEMLARLHQCLQFMQVRLDQAVVAAKSLVSPVPNMFGGVSWQVNPGAVEVPCVLSANKITYDKCGALNAYGQAVHVIQDGYAHSNWVDRPRAGSKISANNPPGLDRATLMPIFDTYRYNVLRGPQPPIPPREFTTECFKTGGCKGRVEHDDVAKDRGLIDAQTGLAKVTAKTSDRGRLPGYGGNTNFQNAVTLAIADTKRQWARFVLQILELKPETRAALTLCAIRRDDPVRNCRIGI